MGDRVVAAKVQHHDVIPTPVSRYEYNAQPPSEAGRTNQLQTEVIRYRFHIRGCSRGTLNITMNGIGRASSGATYEVKVKRDVVSMTAKVVTAAEYAQQNRRHSRIFDMASGD